MSEEEQAQMEKLRAAGKATALAVVHEGVHPARESMYFSYSENNGVFGCSLQREA